MVIWIETGILNGQVSFQTADLKRKLELWPFKIPISISVTISSFVFSGTGCTGIGTPYTTIWGGPPQHKAELSRRRHIITNKNNTLKIKYKSTVVWKYKSSGMCARSLDFLQPRNIIRMPLETNLILGLFCSKLAASSWAEKCRCSCVLAEIILCASTCCMYVWVSRCKYALASGRLLVSGEGNNTF